MLKGKENAQVTNACFQKQNTQEKQKPFRCVQLELIVDECYLTRQLIMLNEKQIYCERLPWISVFYQLYSTKLP